MQNGKVLKSQEKYETI